MGPSMAPPPQFSCEHGAIPGSGFRSIPVSLDGKGINKQEADYLGSGRSSVMSPVGCSVFGEMQPIVDRMQLVSIMFYSGVSFGRVFFSER